MDVPWLDFRVGDASDAGWLLSRFDEAVAWMVARGQPGQWGSEPFSRRASSRRRVGDLCADGGLRVASLDGEDVAALVVGDRPGHVAAIARPELYIHLLLVSRAHAGRRIGEALVDRALAEARTREAEVVRVDCWAGAPTLVAWYENRGFCRAGTFTVFDDWVGQVFAIEP